MYFSRFSAPFLEIDCCSPIDIRRGETALKQDRDFDPRDIAPMQMMKSRSDGRFFDLRDYIYFRLDDPPKWHEVFTLRFPIRARVELIAALWLCMIAAVFLHRRNVRFLLNPVTGGGVTRRSGSGGNAGRDAADDQCRRPLL